MTTFGGTDGGRPIRSTRGLGALVRARRREIGLSQSALATRAGVSRQWVSFVEAGKPTAEVGRLLQVVEALGLELRVHDAGGGGGSRDLDALLEGHRGG